MQQMARSQPTIIRMLSIGFWPAQAINIALILPTFANVRNSTTCHTARARRRGPPGKRSRIYMNRNAIRLSTTHKKSGLCVSGTTKRRNGLCDCRLWQRRRLTCEEHSMSHWSLQGFW